jgi:hypothetical protein
MCRFSIEVVAINGSPYGRAGETLLADNPIVGAVEFLSFESSPLHRQRFPTSTDDFLQVGTADGEGKVDLPIAMISAVRSGGPSGWPMPGTRS